MTNQQVDLSTCHIASKYSFEQLGEAADALDKGVSMKEVLAATGMSYSPVWRFWTWRKFAIAGDLESLPVDEMAAAKRVAELRAQDLSWGEIGVKVSVPESRARRLFEVATGVQAVGTRTEKGGRFWGQLDHDEESRRKAEALYRGQGNRGERSGHGPSVDIGTSFGQALKELDPDDRKVFEAMTKKELGKLLKDSGIAYDSKATKATLIGMIANDLS
jgi:hypothetical protein